MILKIGTPSFSETLLILFAVRCQSVHWIGVQFDEFMSLETRNESLNMLNFDGTIKKKPRTKKNKKNVIFAEIAYVKKTHNMASVNFRRVL